MKCTYKTKIQIFSTQFFHDFLIKRFSEPKHQSCNIINLPFISVALRKPANINVEKSPSKLGLDHRHKQDTHHKTEAYCFNNDSLAEHVRLSYSHDFKINLLRKSYIQISQSTLNVTGVHC